MIHRASANATGYLGYIREFRAVNRDIFPRKFHEVDMLTMFVYKDRLVIIGVPFSLRAHSAETGFAFVDPLSMMARAHRSFAPKGPEALRTYSEGRKRGLPVLEIPIASMGQHNIQAVRPARGFKRDGTALTINLGTKTLSLTGKATHVQTLSDWLSEVRRP